MKLLSLLSNVILEQFGQRLFKVGPAIRDGRRIDLFATYHQQEERNGKVHPSFDDYTDEAALIRMGQWRSGVPNIWILDSIRKRFDQVFQTLTNYEDVDGNVSSILFVDEVLFENDYYPIEYVVAGKRNDEDKFRLNIITSALPQNNREFLRKKQGVPYIRLTESKEFQNIPVVYLCE